MNLKSPSEPSTYSRIYSRIFIEVFVDSIKSNHLPVKYLIHFTNSFPKLCSIVESSSLLLKYCQEDFYFGQEKVSRAAHPMVCFSKHDINELSKLKITYGKYGIAFFDEWAIKNRIHQVSYFDKESVLAEALSKLLSARRNIDSNLPPNLRLPIMQLKCFTKNARGYNSSLKAQDFNFAEENEWRFVPKKKDIGNGLLSQNRSTYLQNKEAHNRKLLPYPLRFKKKDISNIFVSTNEELNALEVKGFSSDVVSLSTWTIKTYV